MALKRGGTNSYTPLIQVFPTTNSGGNRYGASSVTMRVDAPKDMKGKLPSVKKKKKKKRRIGLIYRK